MKIFTLRLRTLFLSAVLAVVAFCVSNVAAQGAGGAGTFTDKRDGKTYKTVKIGGKTWMAQNLNYKTPKSYESGCYDNKNPNCDKYGRLYSEAGYEGTANVCPSGWHVSTMKEWVDLVAAVGGSSAGKNLKAKTGWAKNGNGTDAYGFSALPGGARVCGCMEEDCCGDEGLGNEGRWWAAGQDGDEVGMDDLSNLRKISYDGDGVDSRGGGCGEGNRCSVRCVQN